MKYIIAIAALALAGCNNTTRIFDSEISALNRQTKVLEAQNAILERIATALEKQEGGAR